MTTGIYELAILGDVTPATRDTLITTLEAMIRNFDLVLGQDVIVHDGESVRNRDKRVAFACAYFGGGQQTDIDAAEELVRDSAPVIPTVEEGSDFNAQIPAVLQGANASLRRRDDPAMQALASALLECVGLLRRQRRVFVSYRRNEAKAAAVELHDLLSERGFEVFLDTHAIRPGEPFQEVLWHRLVDSDVMVMLDTPTYFESRWTRDELGRARAKQIQILRIIWPHHTPNRQTDLAETVYLDHTELEREVIVPDVAEAIVHRVERLRSRSIAARYMTMVGKLRAEVEQIGGAIEGVGAHRAIAVRLPDDRKIWAYPVVGVPTAEILYDVAEKAQNADRGEAPVLVYDNVGIRDAWGAHLAWLDQHIRVVRSLKVHEAGWQLAAWDTSA